MSNGEKMMLEREVNMLAEQNYNKERKNKEMRNT
jgi:hypothetical protein